MSNPVIIFGAGASYDYILPDHQYDHKPGYHSPVTRELFSRYWVERANDAFTSRAADLIAYINRKISPDRTFEALLTERVNKFGQTTRILTEKVALVFYLHELFRTVSAEIGNQRANNYDMMLDECRSYLEVHPEEEIVCATFNYDTLLDRALGFTHSNGLDHYVSSKIKLVKLHGSSDWSYYLGRDEDNEASDSPYEYYIRNPAIINNLDGKSLAIQRISSLHTEKDENGRTKLYYPAIAIPLNGKDQFVCPPNHTKYLFDAIEKTNKVLIIGWRGNDDLLLNALKERRSQDKIKIHVVSSKPNTAQEIVNERFQGIPNAEVTISQAFGFGKFVRSPEIENFFA